MSIDRWMKWQPSTNAKSSEHTRREADTTDRTEFSQFSQAQASGVSRIQLVAPKSVKPTVSEPSPRAPLTAHGRTAAPSEKWYSWYVWKAKTLNEMFRDQGKTGVLGKITPETIRQGERSVRRK